MTDRPALSVWCDMSIFQFFLDLSRDRLSYCLKIQMRLKRVPWLILILLPLQAADPAQAVYWSASQMVAAGKKAEAKLNPATKVGSEQLLDSATLIFRSGASEAEVHEKRADLIFVREGEGTVLVGGKIVEERRSGPGELRGASIEGGSKYNLATGDTLYVPANIAHQFLVQQDKHFVAIIVKIPAQ
jgi:mannose-6-phosphate isomerase-like protein (cupin superfamily)